MLTNIFAEIHRRWHLHSLHVFQGVSIFFTIQMALKLTKPFFFIPDPELLDPFEGFLDVPALKYLEHLVPNHKDSFQR